MSQGKPKNKSHWNPSHPGEVARDKLRKEIKAGRITRPDQCVLCGTTQDEIIGHHWRGYAYPLDVWWICRSCNTCPALTHDGTQTIDEARQLVSAMTTNTKSKAAAKIDNSHLDAKLDLRRYFLDKYHVGPGRKIDVLDCCQGSEQIWSALKSEYPVSSYWGIDLKKKPGRVFINGGSQRILAMPGWPQNVIDIDTYGSPWEHWFAMLPNVTKPVTVFMTIGDHNAVSLSAGATGANHIELPPSTPAVLAGMVGRKIAPNILLTRASEFGIIVAETMEAFADGQKARYIGCHLIPKT